jgi:aminotransferase
MNNIDIRSLFLNYWEVLDDRSRCADLGMGMPPLSMFQPILEISKEFPESQQIWRAEYQHQAGDKDLRKAFAKFESDRTKIEYTYENIMLVSGALRGFSVALDCLGNNETSFVEIVPTYPLCSGQVRNILEKRGGSLTTITPKDTDTFQITFDEIKPHIKPSAIIYLTYPNNPTGLYLPEDLLHRLIKTCEQEGAYLILDQACDIPLTVPSDHQTYLDSPSVIRILSLAKTYLLAGVRIGYIVADTHLIKKFSNSFSFSDGNAPCIANETIINYLNNPQLMPFISQVTRHKVELSLKKLEACHSIINIIKPEACFYIFLKIRYPKDSWSLFKELVSKGINVLPGCLFGVDTEPWIRICCGREDPVLLDHLDKLINALDSL